MRTHAVQPTQPTDLRIVAFTNPHQKLQILFFPRDDDGKPDKRQLPDASVQDSSLSFYLHTRTICYFHLQLGRLYSDLFEFLLIGPLNGASLSVLQKVFQTNTSGSSSSSNFLPLSTNDQAVKNKNILCLRRFVAAYICELSDASIQ